MGTSVIVECPIWAVQLSSYWPRLPVEHMNVFLSVRTQLTSYVIFIIFELK